MSSHDQVIPGAQDSTQHTTTEEEQEQRGLQPAGTLYMPLTSLIGREREVSAACTLLARQEVRLLTLTGTGGVGKTRLALQVAAQVKQDFEDGIYLVSLAPLQESELVLPTIVQALGLPASAQPPLEHLQTTLREKHLLLVLDNFEQVIDAAPGLVEMLGRCPRLTLLVTSREVLRIRGEHVLPVPALALPDLKHQSNWETLSRYGAVALFVERAQEVQSGFQITADAAGLIAEICVRLDGLPLALELAAARLRLLSLQALLERLAQRLTILTGGARDLPTRQQTLRNTITWSYDLLSPHEQRLFRCLAVFVGGCTLEAVEAVCGTYCDGGTTVLEGACSLLDKHLLLRIGCDGQERLLMLETLREYAVELLCMSSEMETVRQAHALYYLALAEQAEPELVCAQQAIWLDRLEFEHDNLRAAMHWMLEQSGKEGADFRIEMALRLGGALRQFWDIRGHFSEGRAFLEKGLAASEGVDAAVRAKALNTAASLAVYQGDIDHGERLAEQALALNKEIKNPVGGAGFSLYLLSQVAWTRGNFAAARALSEKSLTLRREAGDQRGAAWSLFNLAFLVSIQGEYVQGQALFEECLTLFRKSGNKEGIAWSLFNLARVLYVSQADTMMVISLLEESLALCRDLNNKEGVAYCFTYLAQVKLMQGDTATARSLAEESLVLCKEIGNQLGTVLALSTLARVASAQGEHKQARALFEECLEIALTKDVKVLTAPCLEGLAGAVMAEGELARAARLWGAAEALRERMGTPLPPVERTAYVHLVNTARLRLGESIFAATWAEGRAMSAEQALVMQEQPLAPGKTKARANKDQCIAPSRLNGLTAREVEVLRLVAQGLSDSQVAQTLIISPRTVNAHLRSIYSKLNITSRHGATLFAFEQHLI